MVWNFHSWVTLLVLPVTIMESNSGLESDNTFILIPLLQSTNLRSIVHENEISEQSATVTGTCTDVFQNP